MAVSRGTEPRSHLQGFYTALGHGNAPWPRRAWAGGGATRDLVSARSKEVGVATEMLLTKAEQVSDDGACAAGLRLLR